jgi:organic hydroperoxide reductase OsmC/OhrA
VEHTYHASVRWTGSTGAGYDHYDRTHRARAEPAAVELTLAADAAFRGDPTQLNPEQLVVLAASSCQLLAFLAVAARARIDVVAYADAAEAVMPENDPPVRITRIALRPKITVALASGADATVVRATVARLVQVAHRECYVANTLCADIIVEPTIDVGG